MGRVSEHIARKDRACDDYPRCSHGIWRGQRYRRYVAFPGDEGHEHGERPWVLTMCAGCAADFGVPITGARVEIFRLNRSEVEVIATGIITKSIFRSTGVESYEVTVAEGVVHKTNPYKIKVLEAIA